MAAGDGPLHPAAAPRVSELLRLLRAHDVRFVLAGSAAVRAHGVALEPGDLDVVPDTSRENLRRVATAIEAVGGRPAGPFGDWVELPNGEKKWEARPTSQAEIDAWAPDPEDVASFDHKLRTRLGDLDLVPTLAGGYAELAARAVTLSVEGVDVPVASIADLLAKMTVPRREKDVPRVAALRSIQRGESP